MISISEFMGELNQTCPESLLRREGDEPGRNRKPGAGACSPGRRLGVAEGVRGLPEPWLSDLRRRCAACIASSKRAKACIRLGASDSMETSLAVFRGGGGLGNSCRSLGAGGSSGGGGNANSSLGQAPAGLRGATGVGARS